MDVKTIERLAIALEAFVDLIGISIKGIGINLERRRHASPQGGHAKKTPGILGADTASRPPAELGGDVQEAFDLSALEPRIEELLGHIGSFAREISRFAAEVRKIADDVAAAADRYDGHTDPEQNP